MSGPAPPSARMRPRVRRSRRPLARVAASAATAGSITRRALEDVDEEPVSRLGFQPPGEHVWIEQVPVAAVAHLGAGLRARHDQPLRGEHLDRLAHDRAADFRSPSDPRPPQLAGLQLAAQDPHPDVVHEFAVQAAARVRLAFHHTITILLDTCRNSVTFARRVTRSRQREKGGSRGLRSTHRWGGAHAGGCGGAARARAATGAAC